MAKIYGSLTLAFLLGLSGTAWAVDGVVDINQARALAGGVSPGDTAGFPVTISQTGSYRLTGNLTVPDADTTGVEISASNVTLDLNGFGIFGPTVCTGTPVTSCAPTASGASGNGIRGTGGDSIAVMNGTVQGMGSVGVLLGGPYARVENVRAIGNAKEGILVGDNSRINGNLAARNGGSAGIFAGSSVLKDNVAQGNLLNGISCSKCTVVDNVAVSNGDIGIAMDLGTVTGNTAASNGSFGIFISRSGTVTGNTSTENTGRGLASSDVLGNVTGYANNVFNDNNGGNANPQVAGGVQMGTNVCGGDTTCP